MDKRIRQIQAELRRRGFKRIWAQRQGNRALVAGYELPLTDRVLKAQVWQDTRSGRMSHSHVTPFSPTSINACENTVPTDFNTVEEMVKAIERESKRMDGINKSVDDHAEWQRKNPKKRA